ncbi:MAG: hypothetical protein WAM14_19140 [Candidatus Nitrosopolaris sp.]
MIAQLVSPITATQTTNTVASDTGFPAPDFYIYIGSEILQVMLMVPAIQRGQYRNFQKVKDFAQENHIMSNQVNIVGHSKGGLDARKYLAQTGTHDVANLVMIGTPNGGDTLANEAANLAELGDAYPFFPYYHDWYNLFCRPALNDLTTGAPATESPENINTKYYTIYGNWDPSRYYCPTPPASSLGSRWAWDNLAWPGWEEDGYYNLNRPNDGIVPASSVEWLPHYIHHTNLGSDSINDCHTNLLGRTEYDLTKKILNPSLP